MMGIVNSYRYHRDPEGHPYDNSPLEFDPHYGFPEGARVKKERRVTLAEIESMQVPYEFRSYCLHKALEAKVCQRKHAPFIYKCADYVHDYHVCENEELKDRLKDYERERRLLQRRKRIKKMQEARRAKAALQVSDATA